MLKVRKSKKWPKFVLGRQPQRQCGGVVVRRDRRTRWPLSWD